MASILNATTSSGLVTSADNSGSLQLATNNGTTAVTIDTSQNVGIGTATPAANPKVTIRQANNTTDGGLLITSADGTGAAGLARVNDGGMTFRNGGDERMRINSSGALLVGTTSAALSNNGLKYEGTNGALLVTRTSATPFAINRLTDDGNLVEFYQATALEGSISVSGSTVSYNGGHLSRWAQTTAPKDETLVKGTVLSNLDEMNEYVDAEGNPVDNEQLNKVKISDVESDVNVAGVFVNWSFDEQHNVDEINMAMTGDMIIRIAEGVVVQKGDLLMSAGDGTAKPQGDDIVRSKTIAKVTSNHVTCTYADGSYCVPCVLMAC